MDCAGQPRGEVPVETRATMFPASYPRRPATKSKRDYGRDLEDDVQQKTKISSFFQVTL